MYDLFWKSYMLRIAGLYVDWTLRGSASVFGGVQA